MEPQLRDSYVPERSHALLLIPSVLALLVAGFVVVGITANALGLSGGDSTAGLAEVPTVVGLSDEEAEAALTEAGFDPVLRRQRNLSEPAGLVTHQNPRPGQKVQLGTEVLVTVSAGSDFVLAPRIVGTMEYELALHLYSLGLGVGEVTTRQDRAPAGEVIEQSVVPGTEVATGSVIDVVVSTGPELIDIPHVGEAPDTPVDSVRSVLASAGFMPVIRDVETDWPAGTFLGIVPGSGEKAPEGSNVAVFVASERSERVADPVPAVEGTRQRDAEVAIMEAGLYPLVSLAYSETVPKGHVISQSPEPGTQLDYDANVSIVVSIGPEGGGEPPVASTTTTTTWWLGP